MSSSGPRSGPLGLIRFAGSFSSLQRILFVGFGGVLLNGFINVIDLVNAGFELFIQPVIAFADGLAFNVTTIVTSFPRIIEQGVRTTITSIAPGATFAVGPLTFLLSIGIAGAGAFLLATVMAQAVTSNFALGGLIDLPTPFFEGPEEDEDTE